MTGPLRYSVGRATADGGWYVPMPWHLRGTAQEILAQYHPERFQADCRGIEFRDRSVQYLRYEWPEEQS